MKRIALLLLVLNACTQTNPVTGEPVTANTSPHFGFKRGKPIPLTTEQRTAAESAARFSSPGFAPTSFGPMAAGSGPDRQIVICGYADKKDSSGSQSHEVLFVAEARGAWLAVLGIAKDEAELNAFRDECHFSGAAI